MRPPRTQFSVFCFEHISRNTWLKGSRPSLGYVRVISRWTRDLWSHIIALKLQLVELSWAENHQSKPTLPNYQIFKALSFQIELHIMYRNNNFTEHYLSESLTNPIPIVNPPNCFLFESPILQNQKINFFILSSFLIHILFQLYPREIFI